MIKKTLLFENPAYLFTRNEQLVIRWPAIEKQEELSAEFKQSLERTIPIEDIGVVILDNKQITLTHALIEKLLANNSALITCDSKHHPVGLMLPLCGNTTQTERFKQQIEASLPLKKQLWQRTISAKISNQAAVLAAQGHCETENMRIWAKNVRSGDSENLEARAAVYYWKNLFPQIPEFIRDREGEYPNNFLNYGYAILRAITARALVCSGLLPTLGIFHRNKYNAYCLADDIMEPYRPYIDKFIIEIMHSTTEEKLTTEIKRKLLTIPTIEVTINNKRSPLMVAISTTTASLQRCFAQETKDIIYPKM